MDYKYRPSGEALLKFHKCTCPATEQALFIFYSKFAKEFGPALIPFFIRRECLVQIPYKALGLNEIDPAQFTQHEGEMWILFCFKGELLRVQEQSPVRSDGFVLILEWRKDEPDSELLSPAFHELASLVRQQQRVEGWGLYPALARYGDKIDFTDRELFADGESVSQIASAYGALMAGLYCTVHHKYPEHWPFPTIQWDGDSDTGRVVGVGGLREKFSVAVDYGAITVAVAQEQKREARSIVKRMRQGPEGARFRKISIYSVKHTDDVNCLAEDIAYGASNFRRLIRRIVAGITIPFCLLLIVLGVFVWDATLEVESYHDSFCDVFGEPQGIGNVRPQDVKDRLQSYRIIRQGYASMRGMLHRNRVVRRITCVNAKERPVQKRMETSLGLIDGHSVAVDWNYEYEGDYVRVLGKTYDGLCVFQLEYNAREPNRANLKMYPESTFSIGELFVPELRSCPIIVTRNDKGFITAIRYVEGLERTDSTCGLLGYGKGISTLSFAERDADGRVVSVRCLDAKGVPCIDSNGQAEYRYRYSAGVPQEIQAINGGITNRVLSVVSTLPVKLNTLLSNGPLTGVTTCCFRLQGENLIEEGRVTANGDRKVYEYSKMDQFGYPQCIKTFLNGKLSLVQHSDRQYEDNVLCSISNCNENADGEKVPLPNGSFVTEILYDKEGKWNIESRYDEKGRLFYCSGGGDHYGQVRIKHLKTASGLNALGEEKNICLLDEKFQPVNCSCGWHRLRTSSGFQGGGNYVARQEFYGLSNELIRQTGIFAPASIKQIEFIGKNLSRHTYFGTHGEAILIDGQGFHCLDVVRGAATRFCLYDCATNPIPKCLDINKKPIYYFELEHQTNYVAVTFWNALVGGEKMDSEYGWAELRVYNNECGQEVKQEKYDSKGRLLQTEYMDNGVINRIQEYDASGVPTRLLKLDETGEFKSLEDDSFWLMLPSFRASRSEKMRRLKSKSEQVISFGDQSAQGVRACFEYACHLLAGDGVKKDVESALRNIEKCAMLGDRRACLKLGDIYLE